MSKSKELAEEFVKNYDGTEKALINCCGVLLKYLLQRTTQLIKDRHAQTDGACVSVIEEVNAMYKSCVSLINEKLGEQVLKQDGFEKYFELHEPQIYQAWKLITKERNARISWAGKRYGYK